MPSPPHIPLTVMLELPADLAALALLECHIVPVQGRHYLATLLFGVPGEENTIADTMRSLVWYIGSDGQSEIWQPGKHYPGSSIWFAEQDTGILLGNDFHKPDAIYACRCDGTHIGSFTLPLLWDNPIRPRHFAHAQRGIEYLDARGELQCVADIATLRSRAKDPAGNLTAHLTADWHPRRLLLPANFPGTEEFLFRLNCQSGQLRLDCVGTTQSLP